MPSSKTGCYDECFHIQNNDIHINTNIIIITKIYTIQKPPSSLVNINKILIIITGTGNLLPLLCSCKYRYKNSNDQIHVLTEAFLSLLQESLDLCSVL